VTSNAPLVSIVVPTYNRRALLAEAIRSIHAQSCTSWELFVVDDGSTDETAGSLLADSRIQLLAAPHGGNVARLRNMGLTGTTGTYVAFLDSDDLWVPTHLEQLVATLEQSPGCGWCYGKYELIDDEGRPVHRVGAVWRPRSGRFVRELLTTEAGIPLQTILVRRELAQRIAFDPRLPFGDDYDFIVRLAHAAEACVVDALVARIREHGARANKSRHDFPLYAGLAHLRYRRGIFSGQPALQRICARQARFLLRHYLANERAAGRSASALWRVGRLAVTDVFWCATSRVLTKSG
jgi:glycosyltransferase involved in cell wall biosynthesis